jgi:CRP/FNR family cyclic AMP-dependent transcriptional regulator
MTAHPRLLDSLSARDRDVVLARAVRRTLRRGEHLYLAGQRTSRAHVVEGGLLKLVGRNGDGRTSVLCLARPGELVGDLAALHGRPQPLDAVAATRCEVLGLDADALLAALRAAPGAALAAAATMAERLRWVSTAALERSTSPVPARLAGRLLDLGELLGTPAGGAIEVDLPLGQDDLGRLAGMCRESACKTLSAFRRRGLLEYRGRRLRILRPDALERIRCTGRL